jgi:hypothetical protein
VVWRELGSYSESDLRERAGITFISVEPGLVLAEGDPLGQARSVEVENTALPLESR